MSIFGCRSVAGFTSRLYWFTSCGSTAISNCSVFVTGCGVRHFVTTRTYNNWRFLTNCRTLKQTLVTVTLPGILQDITVSMSSSSSPRSEVRGLSDEVKNVKDKYLNMELDAKRKLYKCEDDYVTLSSILNWKEYFAKEEIQPATVEEKKYEPNDVLNSKISLWQGDITTLEIDAIVNAANSTLLGGGGVDGAIHRAAGSKLVKECRELHGCPAGQAKITGGYKLPAKHVIHTVGPQGEHPEVLRSCYIDSLQLMLENKLRSIAFPCIATGVYGYPREGAANVALTTVREFLEKNSDKVDRVIFTVFLDEDKEVYEEFLQKYFPLK